MLTIPKARCAAQQVFPKAGDEIGIRSLISGLYDEPDTGIYR